MGANNCPSLLISEKQMWSKDKKCTFFVQLQGFFFFGKTKFKMERENMVHLEIRYLTHSKCFAMIKIKPDIMPLFRTRFRIFDELVTWILFRLRFKVIGTWCSFPLSYKVRIFWSDTLTFFRTRFRVFDDLVTFLFFCTRFWGNITFLFRMRFEMVLYRKILLSSSERGLGFLMILWLFFSSTWDFGVIFLSSSTWGFGNGFVPLSLGVRNGSL